MAEKCDVVPVNFKSLENVYIHVNCGFLLEFALVI